MTYLTKNITKVFLIDFFTPEERASVGNEITQKLETLLNSKGIPVESFMPNSEAELLDALESINTAEIGDGLIIHFIGHGDETAVGFGNTNYFVEWTTVRPFLVNINTRSNDGLIMNTSIMCHGKNIFEVINGAGKPFFAAIGSLTMRSLQAYYHNKELYEKCLDRDRAAMWLDAINSGLEQSQGQKQYELRYV
jgi:hypothetical protein